MAVEIQLINQIEQHEFLYNFNLPQYNRKDMVEEAWANIAANTNMSISDCKEKWRNIRSSFLRSMKPSGMKVKKPYYLTEYLKFILPFLKPTSTGIEGADDSQYGSPSQSNEDELVSFIKEEPVDGDAEDTAENNGDNAILSDLLTRRPPVLRKRRRFIPTRKCNDALRNKSKSMTSAFQRNFPTQPDLSANGNNSATKMFLMSLLPELDTMTEDQMRLFKIKSMMLIDEIKVNYSQVRQSATTINNERLQKRLINLLLKNLQKATKDNGKIK
uniref:MADF domain-containing protein n=2 Tax=Heliothis virescens TaxID=7102 RepID=A0A2A4J1L5_HELVI